MDCIFCNIANGHIAAKITYETELVLGFEDLHPQAPEHHLIIPRKHIATLNDLTQADSLILGHMIESASILAKQRNIAEAGIA